VGRWTEEAAEEAETIEIEKQKEVKPRVKKEKQEQEAPYTWIKCDRAQYKELVEFMAAIKRISKWKRFNPESPDNIAHNRQEPALLKKGVELMEKIL
jgi:hypothetical protein